MNGGGAAGGNITLGTATLTLNWERRRRQTYAGAISGSGGLVKTGGVHPGAHRLRQQLYRHAP